jgi:hypothetical protein
MSSSQNETRRSHYVTRRDLLAKLATAGALGGAGIVFGGITESIIQPVHATVNDADAAGYIIDNELGTFNAYNGTTGAIDNSGTNAAAVIQYAIDHLPNGGIVHLKQATYPITAPLVPKDFMIIEGEGQTTKLSASTPMAAILNLNGRDSDVVRDLTLEMLAGSGTTPGINMGTGYTPRNSINRCRFIANALRTGQYGIEMLAAYSTAPYWNTIFDCFFNTLDKGIELGGDIAGPNDNFIISCRFSGCTRGIHLTSANVIGNQILGGSFDAYTTYGIDCNGVANILRGAYFEGSTTATPPPAPVNFGPNSSDNDFDGMLFNSMKGLNAVSDQGKRNSYGRTARLETHLSLQTKQFPTQFSGPATLAVRTKAGTPADGDFANQTPGDTIPNVQDGMIVADTTASRIWVRIGEVWKYAQLSTS